MSHLKVVAVIFALSFGCIWCDFRPGIRLALGIVHISFDLLQNESTTIFPSFGFLLVSPYSWVLFEKAIVAHLLEWFLPFKDGKFQNHVHCSLL